jgi:hypothetical protein
MHHKTRQYCDTWAAPGSALYQALEEKRWYDAQGLYLEAEEEYRRYNDPDTHGRIVLALEVYRKDKAREAAALQLIAIKR